MVAASPAPIVAAAMAAARNRVVRTFTDEGATSPDRAIAYDPPRRLDRRIFQRMLRFGAAVDAGDGRFWVDETRLAAWDARRRKRALALVGGALAATLAFLGLSQL